MYKLLFILFIIKLYARINIFKITWYYIYEPRNSKTSKSHVLILNLTDKLDLKEAQKVLLYQILVFTMHGKT